MDHEAYERELEEKWGKPGSLRLNLNYFWLCKVKPILNYPHILYHYYTVTRKIKNYK